MENHLVITQHPNGHAVHRSNFVLRNRTMALVSHGTIIVEAGEKSGTQHQGWEAIRLGRILFIPEHLLSASFDWPRKMRDYGAIVFSGCDELIELLDEFLPSSPLGCGRSWRGAGSASDGTRPIRQLQRSVTRHAEA